MKKTILTIGLLAFISTTAFTQETDKRLPEFDLEQATIETQLRFLAADELMGRRTGSAGNNIAARYIAARLEALGYQSPEGAEAYFQKIPFAANQPPQVGSLQVDEVKFTLGEDLVLLDGQEKEITATAVYANFGWVDEANEHDDYKDLDVTGKVVVVLSGLPTSDDPSEVFAAMGDKRKFALERGAVGLVEIYTLSYPWRFFRNYFSRERIEISQDMGTEGALIHAWVQGADKEVFGELKAGKELPIVLNSGAAKNRSLASQNVIGVLEGSDPDLKDEYLLITAHYDHVGVGKQGGGAYGPQDSIFNGA
ncbi:MAG: M28 family peptidase, partial [Saprospiraceae bacterium]|nr:M28 family peptidase [Saprospiraceae bacterium]